MMHSNNYYPKVSIVIPAYNASNYLADAIDSALAQDYKNLEIIVVNDGSKDGGKTRAVAERYNGKIRYFEKENGGSSSALNCGIENMTGDWFSWLSHDDLYYSNKVSKQVSYLNEMNLSEKELECHVLFAANDLIDKNGRVIRKAKGEREKQLAKKVQAFEGNQYLIAEPTTYVFHGCSCLVHKSVFENIGKFDENLRLINDVDLWYRLYANNYHIHYLPCVLVQGRIHDKQVSRSIGFSYHNSEQDLYWKRSLEWLKSNFPNNQELFCLYGRNAYLKTRDIEGDMAEGARTFPILYGKKIPSIVSIILIVVTTLMCPILYFFKIFNIYYMIIMIVPIIIFLYSAYSLKLNPSEETCAKVSKNLKIAMLIELFVL